MVKNLGFIPIRTTNTVRCLKILSLRLTYNIYIALEDAKVGYRDGIYGFS